MRFVVASPMRRAVRVQTQVLDAVVVSIVDATGVRHFYAEVGAIVSKRRVGVEAVTSSCLLIAERLGHEISCVVTRILPGCDLHCFSNLKATSKFSLVNINSSMPSTHCIYCVVGFFPFGVFVGQVVSFMSAYLQICLSVGRAGRTLTTR